MIKINHADKYYNRGSGNELHVLNDVTLELPERGMVAVFGPSGCGKTTLLNTIGGLDRLNSGSISVFDEDIARHTDRLRNQYIGYIFQNYNLSADETVAENVADALRLCGMSDGEEIQRRVLAALTNVGMEKFRSRPPDTLSGGQQQRVAIARALVKNPAIILADEPTGNLDEANTVMVMDILKQVAKDHLVVLVTHEANLVDYYCDQVIELRDGRIQSVRSNEGANGYSGRGKNAIYLGELEAQEEHFPGVHLTYYGEPGEEIRLKIVHANGKLYLKSETPELKLLDESSEIKLLEGVYREPSSEEKAGRAIDMSALGAVEGAKYGRLFSFRSAVTSGFRENFSRKSKKSRRLLRASMILLAIVVVFMSANFAVGIKSRNDLKANHNESVFYLPLTQQTDTAALLSQLGQNGIDYARVVGGNYTSSAENIAFRVGNFITASTEPITASGNVLDEKLSAALPLVCGSRTFEKPLDVIITTALADDLIASAGVSFIGGYDDLLNMVSNEKYDGNNYMRITGVVESGEKNFYLQSFYAAYVILQNTYYSQLAVTPATFDTVHTTDIAPGSVAAMSSEATISVGDSVTIMGRSYLISEVVKTYTGNDQYKTFVSDTHKVKLRTVDAYFEQQFLQNENADYTRSALTWFFSYYTQYYQEYCRRCTGLDVNPWIYMTSGSTEFLIASAADLPDVPLSERDLYAGWRYQQANGYYPTESQLKKYLTDNASALEQEYKTQLDEISNENWQAYDQYLWQNGGRSTYFAMNDADYMALSYQTGANDTRVCEYDLFGTWEMYSGETSYEHYLLLHASDAEAAAQTLSGAFGDEVITPDEVLSAQMERYRGTITANLISLAVVLALICLCIFFIMRSSLMSRIRQIGIYRAIGVSKKNLTFRFLIESLVLSTLSLTIAYVLSSAVVMKLASYSFLAETFYLPLWLCAAILVGLYAITVFFGTLPVRLMLRKTPSEILAKYDI